MPNIFFRGGGGTVDAGSKSTYQEKSRIPITRFGEEFLHHVHVCMICVFTRTKG